MEYTGQPSDLTIVDLFPQELLPWNSNKHTSANNPSNYIPQSALLGLINPDLINNNNSNSNNTNNNTNSTSASSDSTNNTGSNSNNSSTLSMLSRNSTNNRKHALPQELDTSNLKNSKIELSKGSAKSRKSFTLEDDDVALVKKEDESGTQKKKPGRKPSTTEPNSKRKAQNRAAQRAFRERKERYIQALETRVKELEEGTDSEKDLLKQENQTLKALIQKLETENYYLKGLSFTFEGPKLQNLPTMTTNNANPVRLSSPTDSATSPNAPSDSHSMNSILQLPSSPESSVSSGNNRSKPDIPQINTTTVADQQADVFTFLPDGGLDLLSPNTSGALPELLPSPLPQSAISSANTSTVVSPTSPSFFQNNSTEQPDSSATNSLLPSGPVTFGAIPSTTTDNSNGALSSGVCEFRQADFTTYRSNPIISTSTNATMPFSSTFTNPFVPGLMDEDLEELLNMPTAQTTQMSTSSSTTLNASTSSSTSGSTANVGSTSASVDCKEAIHMVTPHLQKPSDVIDYLPSMKPSPNDGATESNWKNQVKSYLDANLLDLEDLCEAMTMKATCEEKRRYVSERVQEKLRGVSDSLDMSQ